MKKRILCFILTAVFLLCALCGCEQNAPTKGGTALCEWFDEAGFLEGMSQQEYLLWLDGLSVSGKGLTQIAPYAFFENTYGNGCSGSCSSFSYGREEVRYEQTAVVSYLTLFSLPDGCLLPYDVNLGDGVPTVLAAFGYADSASFFLQGRAEKTLLDTDAETIILRNLSVSSKEVGYLYPYQLLYTERYEAYGNIVERSLEFFFSEGQDPTLAAVRIHMSEKE